MNDLPPALWWLLAAVIAYFAVFSCIVWLRGLEERPPQERELAKASHGIALIICAAYLIYAFAPWKQYPMTVYAAYGLLCILGLFWLFIGSGRAQIYGDRRLQIRAVVKFAMGWVFFGILHYSMPHVPWKWRGWFFPAVMSACIWCWVTGVVQFIICSRGRPRLPPPGDPDSYGGARFPGASGLGGETR